MNDQETVPTHSAPFESDGQLLIENDDDEVGQERLLDTTIPPPVFASDHVMPKSSIYEVIYSMCP